MVLREIHNLCRRLALVALLALLVCGCRVLPERNFALDRHIPPRDRIPNGEFKTTLPPYVIEPPDILLVDALKVVPKPPYRIEPLDILQIRAQGIDPQHPIDGNFQVESAGTINLGIPYGSLKVVGLSTDEVTQRLRERLAKDFVNPEVSVSLVQTSGTQQIAGEHLVSPDGMVSLGTYGRVYVAGLTLSAARGAIEKHLSAQLESPKVAVDVAVYNSKVYYVVFDGAGTGDRVIRLPITGGETVIDAISQAGGLTQISTKEMWIARPAPDHLGYEQRLPINWNEVSRGSIQATNYQLLPGDRLFISGNKATLIDTTMAKVLAPLERASSVILLGSSAIRNLNSSFRNNESNNLSGF